MWVLKIICSVGTSSCHDEFWEWKFLSDKCYVCLQAICVTTESGIGWGRGKVFHSLSKIVFHPRDDPCFVAHKASKTPSSCGHLSLLCGEDSIDLLVSFLPHIQLCIFVFIKALMETLSPFQITQLSRWSKFD